jgi:hypothetical protein
MSGLCRSLCLSVSESHLTLGKDQNEPRMLTSRREDGGGGGGRFCCCCFKCWPAIPGSWSPEEQNLQDANIIIVFFHENSDKNSILQSSFSLKS